MPWRNVLGDNESCDVIQDKDGVPRHIPGAAMDVEGTETVAIVC